MARTSIEVRGLKALIKKLEKAESEAQSAFAQMLEAEGYDLLRLVQEAIIRYQAVDYRRLLNSFDKGGDGNVWRVSNGGLTLEIGTNVKYAEAVNDGHNQKRRWVPGVWQGDRFIYQKGAKTGMMLTEKFVSGRPYWDDALDIFEKMFYVDTRKFSQQWFNTKW